MGRWTAARGEARPAALRGLAAHRPPATFPGNTPMAQFLRLGCTHCSFTMEGGMTRAYAVNLAGERQYCRHPGQDEHACEILGIDYDLVVDAMGRPEPGSRYPLPDGTRQPPGSTWSISRAGAAWSRGSFARSASGGANWTRIGTSFSAHIADPRASSSMRSWTDDSALFAGRAGSSQRSWESRSLRQFQPRRAMDS